MARLWQNLWVEEAARTENEQQSEKVASTAVRVAMSPKEKLIAGCLRIRAAYSNRVMIPAARPTPHRVPAGLKARRHVGDTRLCLRETQVYGSMP